MGHGMAREARLSPKMSWPTAHVEGDIVLTPEPSEKVLATWPAI